MFNTSLGKDFSSWLWSHRKALLTTLPNSSNSHAVLWEHHSRYCNIWKSSKNDKTSVATVLEGWTLNITSWLYFWEWHQVLGSTYYPLVFGMWKGNQLGSLVTMVIGEIQTGSSPNPACFLSLFIELLLNHGYWMGAVGKKAWIIAYMQHFHRRLRGSSAIFYIMLWEICFDCIIIIFFSTV